MRTRLLLRGVGELGPSTTGAIVTSSARMASRRRRDRRAEGGAAVARGPGPLLSAEPLTAPGDESGPLGVCCRFAEADLEVRFLADDIVRLTWGPGEPPIPWALAQPTADHRPSSVVEVTAGTPPATPVRAATPELSVEVTGEGWVSFRGRDDRLLRRELPPLRRGARADGALRAAPRRAGGRPGRAGVAGHTARDHPPAVEPGPRRGLGPRGRPPLPVRAGAPRPPPRR